MIQKMQAKRQYNVNIACILPLGEIRKAWLMGTENMRAHLRKPSIQLYLPLLQCYQTFMHEHLICAYAHTIKGANSKIKFAIFLYNKSAI